MTPEFWTLAGWGILWFGLFTGLGTGLFLASSCVRIERVEFLDGEANEKDQ